MADRRGLLHEHEKTRPNAVYDYEYRFLEKTPGKALFFDGNHLREMWTITY